MIYDLRHGRTALIVIDVQRDYFDPASPAFVPSGVAIVPNIVRLVETFRAKGLPVIFVQHMNRRDGSDLGRMGDFSGDGDGGESFVEGTPGVELIPELPVRDGDIRITKRRYSCFRGTELEPILRTLDVKAIVLVGLMTSFCCETTARDGHGRDYEVLFVSDGNEGPDLVTPSGAPVSHTQVLENTMTALSMGFAEIVTTDEVAARL